VLVYAAPHSGIVWSSAHTGGELELVGEVRSLYTQESSCSFIGVFFLWAHVDVSIALKDRRSSTTNLRGVTQHRRRIVRPTTTAPVGPILRQYTCIYTLYF